jgi:hypothetical protein
MDIISIYVGSPANFLDVGGSANGDQMMEAIKILNNDNEVIDTAVFEINCLEEELTSCMNVLQAVKYIKAEDNNLAGIGNLWDEEREKFYPKNIFINMTWDFDEEKFIPSIPKPENNDITAGDWIWDVEDGEWGFIPPIPVIEGRDENKWVWNKQTQEWIWPE